jgi:predicted phage baseplate assembly protein
MPLIAPNLDDRRYPEILAAARQLIPRYAPEWTNHNDADPGITLLQLFAWMTEMTQFRLNQVPDLNHVKFLQLLGIELLPARPARASLAFTLARRDVDTVLVPRGAQVSAAGADGKPVVFELDEGLVALGAQLAAVQCFDGQSYTVETDRNATPGLFIQPFGPTAREGSALLLGFDTPLAFTSAQIGLWCELHEEARPAAAQQARFSLDQLPLAATLAWEFWDGARWQALGLDGDGTRAFTRSGFVRLRGPGTRALRDRIGQVTAPLYWLRVRLVRSQYDLAPRLDALATNRATATQAVTVRNEVLGGSNGRPGQVWRLAATPTVALEDPLVLRTADGRRVTVLGLQLEVDEGPGFVAWQQVDDFFASGPDDPHFVHDATTGDVRAGDGVHGRIPVANPANPSGNIVARWYRHGGGRAGNVAAGAIASLVSFVDGIDAVTNPKPALGGSDEESLDEAKLRAPQTLKSKGRAVTAEDFEQLALATPGVRIRRALALPLTHPRFDDARVPGVVTVLVVPDSDSPAPLPGEATLAIAAAWLDRHRLVTCEVHVAPPRYRRIAIEARLVVKPQDDLAVVQPAVEAALTAYFHPLTGGEDGGGWPFGRSVYYSDVYRVVLGVPGVDRIDDNQLVVWLDDVRGDFCRDVPIAPGELLTSDLHDIQVRYEATA